MSPLCFKRDRLNQVREDDDDDEKKFFFQTLSPTISLREAKRPPRAGGQQLSLAEIFLEQKMKINS